MSHAVHITSASMKANNRMSSNVMSDGEKPSGKRFGTMLQAANSPGFLDTVEESSEELNFNPHRISDNADDQMIENFLAGNARPDKDSSLAKSKIKKKENSEISGGEGGFTQVRWHDQGS